MSKLLPCPFCGSDARMWPSHTKADEDGSYEIIGCSNVECLIEPTTEDYLPYDEALKRWNTRPTPAPCDELVTVIHRGKYRADGEQYYRYYRDLDGGYDPEKYEEQALVTRHNAEAVIAAKDARIKELERLIGLAQSVHRWNIDASGDGILYVCKDDHDKSEPCEWNAFIPIERAEAENKRLREALDAIASMDDYFSGDRHAKCIEIARAALGEVKP